MSVIDKIRKRRFYPFQIAGETVHIRSLTDSERVTVLEFKDEDCSFGFLIGCGLLNEDQSQAFECSPTESARDFGARVLREANMPLDNRAELSQAIMKLTAGPPQETLVKN